MKKDIKTLLYSMGVYQSYTGYRYFAAAVELSAEDPARLTNMRRDIYQPIADRFDVSVESVEKDIRTIRSVIIKNDGIQKLEEEIGKPIFLQKSLYPRELIEIFSNLK